MGLPSPYPQPLPPTSLTTQLPTPTPKISPPPSGSLKAGIRAQLGVVAAGEGRDRRVETKGPVT